MASCILQYHNYPRDILKKQELKGRFIFASNDVTLILKYVFNITKNRILLRGPLVLLRGILSMPQRCILRMKIVLSHCLDYGSLPSCTHLPNGFSIQCWNNETQQYEIKKGNQLKNQGWNGCSSFSRVRKISLHINGKNVTTVLNVNDVVMKVIWLLDHIVKNSIHYEMSAKCLIIKKRTNR